MSKVKRILIGELKDRFGLECSEVVEFLYSEGMIDDCRVRMHVVRKEVLHRFVNTALNISQIHEDVGEEFGLDRSSVSKIAAL